MRTRRGKAKRDKRRPEDRDPKGKFQPGHGIKSPGNPNFKRIAEYRRMIQDAVSPGDLRRVMLKLKRLALAGDMDAIRELLTRMVGKATAQPAHAEAVSIDLPELTDAKSTARAATAILQAVARGDLSADDAARLGAVVELARKSIETHELADRLAALELKETQR